MLDLFFVGIICAFSLVWLLNIALTAVEIYYLRVLYLYRRAPIIHNRYPKLTVATIVLNQIYSFCNTTFFVVYVARQRAIDRYGEQSFLVVAHSFWFFAFASNFLYMSRLMLLYYAIRVRVEFEKYKWQAIIAPDQSIKPFYLTHKTKYGSWNAVKCFLVGVALFMLGIIVALGTLSVWLGRSSRIFRRASGAVYVIFAVLPMLAVWVLLLKIPKSHDTIGLQYEFKWSTVALSTHAIVCAALNIFFYTVSEMRKPGPGDANAITPATAIFNILSFVLYRCTTFAASMVQTWLILRKFKRWLRRHQREEPNVIELVHQHTIDHQRVQCQTFAKNNPRAKRMKHCLGVNETLDLFVKQCCDEHCMECILSVIEFTQFKAKASEALDHDGDIKIDTNDFALELPDACPLSGIIQNNDGDLKAMASELYEKYIRRNSEWEINISYGLRRFYSTLLEDHNAWTANREYDAPQQIFTLFDPCVQEMIVLLAPTFSRYTSSSQFLLIRS